MKRKTDSKGEVRDRITITLEPETKLMGLDLAREDGRDLSHQIEALIKAAFARKNGNGKEKAA